MKYEILYYDKLDFSGLSKKFHKTVTQLQAGDFKSADVKKLKPTGYLRAKLNDTHRLLFQFIRAENTTYLLLLEVIKNHAYDKSRFLRGTTIDEVAINTNDLTSTENTPTLPNVPQQQNIPVHFLDKFILFDETQASILNQPLPLIIIGSAGSGKTSVTLEKLKYLEGDLLYVSLSDYLVQNARRLYYAEHYENEQQQIDFLSFRECLEMIKIPDGKEIDAATFIAWASKQAKPKYCQDTRKLFEEFRGVLTGSDANVPYLAQETYQALGIKQSIYLQEERESVYALFKKYCHFLKEQSYYDSNILSSEYQQHIEARYDAIVIDEVQDFTNSQLDFILRHVKQNAQFVLSGDANQIVHPNFFSWSKLKSYFYQDNDLQTDNITRILANNYRNTPEVTELANRILKLKNARFGSIDKESHYLVKSIAKHHGVADCIAATPNVLNDFNEKTAKSAKSAILVLTEQQKLTAKQHFKTPLIFTVQEAKGLEYDNIILYQFVSDNPHYQAISKGVDRNFMDDKHTYARVKDKSNKEMEIYKFYINALYVAITRAIKNVYLIESIPSSSLLQLLKIDEIKEIQLDIAQSSKEEWQQEAARLAKQGKTEQADAIEATILQHKSVPWEVLTTKACDQLITRWQETPLQVNKKEKIKLLNYALLYQRQDIVQQLVFEKFKAASNTKRAYQCMDEQFFAPYRFNNDKNLRQEIDKYGLNFRNPFNWTPMMCAAYTGNKKHIQTLLKLGAALQECDNDNRSSLIIALARSWQDKNYRQKSLIEIYPLLSTEPLTLRFHDHLIVIDASRAEYFLLNALLSLYNQLRYRHPYGFYTAAFSAVLLAEAFTPLSRILLPEYRTKNSYISSLLSRNEIDSNYKTNRKLFVRIRRGIYRINPALQIKIQDEWRPLLTQEPSKNTRDNTLEQPNPYENRHVRYG